MHKTTLFLLLVLYAVVVPGFSQTGYGSTTGTMLGDSSQFYVQEIINAKLPVLIDFWAAWCGPCRVLSPIIEEIKKEYKGRIKVLKINIDKNRSLASYFKVVSIPNVFLVKDKIVVSNFPGVQPKKVYIAAITDLLEPVSVVPDSIQ